MDVYIRDHLIQYELHHFHLQLCSRDNIDIAKYMLIIQIWERIGQFSKFSSFQLEQYGIYLYFIDSGISIQILAPVIFIRI